MHRLFTPCLALLALPATAAAQSPLGILNNTNTSYTSRGSNTVPNTNPSVAFVRIDKEHYAGWGVDPANPGSREILGVSGVLQDQIGTTPETFDVFVYTEDAANPNFPVIATPIGSALGIPTPASTAAGATAFGINVTFATPVLAPAAGDVFLGVGMPQPATGTWPTDGLSCHALYYVTAGSSTTPVADLSGAGRPTTSPEDNNSGWYVAPPAYALGATYTVTQRQWKLEPIVAGAAGTAGAITNQTTVTLSNSPPGTSSMSSGLYPDARATPLNAGRMDDIASRWYMAGIPDNSPVLFGVSFSPFGPEIPLNVFTPGFGTVCLDTAATFVLGIGFTTNGESYLVWQFSAAARNVIAGLGITHQSVGLDPVTGMAYANGCTRQIF